MLPKIKIEDIDLGPLGLKRTNIATKVSVTNKNKFPLNIVDARYTVLILPKMLFDKKDTPYLVKFSCKLIDKEGDKTFKGSKFAATIKGTLADLKALKK